MNSVKVQYKNVNVIFMNFKNSKTSDPGRLLLNLADKIDLKRKDKYIALSTLIIYCTWENIKNHIRTINLKYKLQHGINNLNYSLDQHSRLF